jgi:hypothetical protein
MPTPPIMPARAVRKCNWRWADVSLERLPFRGGGISAVARTRVRRADNVSFVQWVTLAESLPSDAECPTPAAPARSHNRLRSVLAHFLHGVA